MAVFCLVSFAFLFAASIAPALAADDPSANYGLDAAAQPAGLKTDDTKTLPERLGGVVGIALSFVGTIFLILIIYAGVMWMTAAGNEQQVTKAKDILIAATIGLVLVLSAYAITLFVGNTLTT